MARALVEIWSSVSAGERAAFLARARDRQRSLQRLGVSFWVFERPDLAGEMVQYVEASAPERLEHARAFIALVPGEREILLQQLEL